MIPFNHLGWIFKTFGSTVYPHSVREALCDFLQPVFPTAKVLDLGSGTGMMCEFAYACRDDLVFVAVDPAMGMLKHVESYVTGHQAVAEALPFNDDSFDVAFMGESLHHFKDVDTSLKETVRVLKQKGRLFIYDFNINTFMGKSICNVEKLLGEPGNFFNPETLKSLLENYGFSVDVKKHGWRKSQSASRTLWG